MKLPDEIGAIQALLLSTTKRLEALEEKEKKPAQRARDDDQPLTSSTVEDRRLAEPVAENGNALPKPDVIAVRDWAAALKNDPSGLIQAVQFHYLVIGGTTEGMKGAVANLIHWMESAAAIADWEELTPFHRLGDSLLKEVKVQWAWTVHNCPRKALEQSLAQQSEDPFMKAVAKCVADKKHPHEQHLQTQQQQQQRQPQQQHTQQQSHAAKAQPAAKPASRKWSFRRGGGRARRA